MTREEAKINLEVMKEHTLTGNWYEEALEMAILAINQVTEVRKLILQAERSGVHLDYGAYKFIQALEKIVGEKQIGEFDEE